MLGVLAQEPLRQQRDLFAPLAQRRHGDADDVQPEEQVLAELPVRDGDLEIAIRGRDDPHVDVHVPPAAEPRELAVLEHLQQLGLQRRMHLADFIQEHRPFVRELELARLLLNRRR